MRRSVELLFIPEGERAAARNLHEKDKDLRNAEEHRLIVANQGPFVLGFGDEGVVVCLGPDNNFNAIRLSPGIRVGGVLTGLSGEIYIITGEENIKAALAHTEKTSFNGGPKFAAAPTVLIPDPPSTVLIPDPPR